VSTADVAILKPETTARLCNLPRFQPTALRLLRVSADSDTAIEEFESLFRSDPALASELLQRANSVEFGLRCRIADIRSALLFLGPERTRALALTICMSLYVQKNARQQEVRFLWRHSLATAVIAEEIGQSGRLKLPDLYTCGLIHDLGRLGLLLSGGDGYSPLLSRPFRNLEEANELERTTFGMRHVEAGTFLARSWNFPPALCDCILRHHDPVAEADRGLVSVVQAACFLAGELGCPEVQELEPVPRELSPAARFQGLPGLEPGRLRELVDERTGKF
jgi:HD-like signal output (HDOD) protein